METKEQYETAPQMDELADESNDHAYFAMMPNMLDDLLDPYQYRLYAHVKRVCGEAKDKRCWQSTVTLADACKMSTGQIAECKRSLEKLGLITITEHKRPHGGLPYHRIAIVDIWARNIEHCTRARSPDERASSPREQASSHSELKKNPHEEDPKNPADADFFGPDGPPQHQPVKAELPQTSDPLVMAGHTAKKGNGKKSWTVTGPEGADPWEGRPLMEWCALISIPYDTLPPSRKRLFASDLQKLAVEVQATPEQTGAAIRQITTDERYSWLHTAGRPTHAGFANALQNILCGASEAATPNVVTSGYRTDAPGAI